MYINDRGQKIFVGQEAIDNFFKGIKRLREGRKLHYKTTFQDLPVSVENRKGSVRSGTDGEGEEWRTKMKVPYGYIPGTKGADGDALDVFVGPNEDAAFAYVVHCNTPDGKQFDEDKVMLGFSSSKSAKQCFMQHYDSSKFFGGIDAIPMWKFRERAFVRKHTSRKLVASKNGAHSEPSLRRYDDGMVPVAIAPIQLVNSFYSDVYGSKMKHKDIEKNIDLYAPDEVDKKLKKQKKGKFGHLAEVRTSRAHEAVTAKIDTLGRGTDQVMKKSILGKNQMLRPEVRESMEGGPGSGRHPESGHVFYHGTTSDKAKKILRQGLKGGYYRDVHLTSSEKVARFFARNKKASVTPGTGHPVVLKILIPKGKLRSMIMKDRAENPKWTKSVAARQGYIPKEHISVHWKGGTLKESEEHGVQGQKWGVRHARNDGAGQKGFQAKYRDLANDPRTMNMMQVVHRSQSVLNAIASRNKPGQQPQQPGQKPNPPKSPEQNHNEALNGLKELGWKIAEVGARLTGTEGLFNAVQSVVKSPAGQKLFLNTDKQGNHNLTLDKQGKAPASKPHQARRTRTSMKESKTYYARSLSKYGTEAEDDDIDLIKESFGGNVAFPKTRRHAELGMGFFHKKINASKRVVIKPVRKNRLTAGVFSEATHALHRKIPVYAIHKGKMRKVKSVEALNHPNKEGHFGRIRYA